MWELVQDYSKSPDPALRKSALTSLGLSIEGCSEYIRPQVRQLWPLIDAGLQDPAQIVRNAACVALGCVCEWLPEEATSRHEFIMPVGRSILFCHHAIALFMLLLLYEDPHALDVGSRVADCCLHGVGWFP